MKSIDKIIHGMKTAHFPSDYWIASRMEFPELRASQQVMQRNHQTVWAHTMAVIDILTIKNNITLLSGLFHDLGKVCVSHMNYPSLPRFPGHSDKSVNIAKIRLAKWGADPHIIHRVIRIVSTHMFDLSQTMKEKTIRKFVADVGVDNIENWFVVRVADSRSYSSHQKYINSFIEPFRRIIISYLEQQPHTSQPLFKKIGRNGVIQIEGVDD